MVDGGHAAFEATEDAIYLAIALRNAGSGIAVLHGWYFTPDRVTTGLHADPKDFPASHVISTCPRAILPSGRAHCVIPTSRFSPSLVMQLPQGGP